MWTIRIHSNEQSYVIRNPSRFHEWERFTDSAMMMSADRARDVVGDDRDGSLSLSLSLSLTDLVSGEDLPF
jgi:hypothetical protein